MSSHRKIQDWSLCLHIALEVPGVSLLQKGVALHYRDLADIRFRALLLLSHPRKRTKSWVLSAGILYASKDSHYSVFKAARMYRMQAVQVRKNAVIGQELDESHVVVA